MPPTSTAPSHQRHRRRGAPAPASVSTLKKKARDLSRLLARSKQLSASGRMESERALAATQHELAVASASKAEQKIARKYHMVRFFERQKATRRLRKVEREVEGCGEGKVPKELRERLRDARVELTYTLHYPKGEKYISLFKDPGDNVKVREKREAIKEDIARRMDSGRLGDVTTMEGGDMEGGNDDDEGRRRVKEGKSKGKKRKRGGEAVQDGGGDIKDDDFFEF